MKRHTIHWVPQCNPPPYTVNVDVSLVPHTGDSIYAPTPVSLPASWLIYLLRGGPRASPEVRPQTNLRIKCLLSYSCVLYVHSLTPVPFSHLRFPRSPYIWLPPLAAPYPPRPSCLPYPTQSASLVFPSSTSDPVYFTKSSSNVSPPSPRSFVFLKPSATPVSLALSPAAVYSIPPCDSYPSFSFTCPFFRRDPGISGP